MSEKKKNPWLLAIPAALATMILNALIHFLYMVVYGFVINPGHPAAIYEQHAQLSGPYSSIIIGIPLVFLASRWLARKFEPQNAIKAALLLWLIYFVLDLTILLLVGGLMAILLLFVVSFSTKLIAAYFGGKLAKAA